MYFCFFPSRLVVIAPWHGSYVNESVKRGQRDHSVKAYFLLIPIQVQPFFSRTQCQFGNGLRRTAKSQDSQQKGTLAIVKPKVAMAFFFTFPVHAYNGCWLFSCRSAFVVFVFCCCFGFLVFFFHCQAIHVLNTLFHSRREVSVYFQETDTEAVSVAHDTHNVCIHTHRYDA